MSEVGGPPESKGLKPVLRVPEIRRREQKPEDQKQPHQQDQPTAKQSDTATGLSRDPAVSLSASMGHIEIGENIAGSILSIDADGRPILITEEATFALTPDVGLKEGDSITLNVVTTDHKLKAELTVRNGNPEDPAPLVATGLLNGRILDEPRGHGGFGYDPLFEIPELAKSVAELEPELKNRISHRGLALNSIINTMGSG